MSERLGSKFYSFHAGFLLDPNIDELGKKFTNKKFNDRQLAKEIFIERVNKISKYAKERNIFILLENNVISSANINYFGANPFLMTDHFEAIEIMDSTDDNVGLLIDVAHLKVSSNSEKFCKKEYLLSTSEYTFAYHLSDNDGKSDTNDKITAESWFWPHIVRELDYYTVEVYEENIDFLVEQIDLTTEMLCK